MIFGGPGELPTSAIKSQILMSIGPFLLSIGILCHTFWLCTYYAEYFFTFLGPSHEVFWEGQIKRFFAAFFWGGQT